MLWLMKSVSFLLIICSYPYNLYPTMLQKRIRPAYFLFLTIPLLYYFLGNIKAIEAGKNQTERNDIFYFSIKTSGPASVELINGNKRLATWKVDSAAYRYLPFCGHLNDAAGLAILVNNLSPNDTISLLSINLFRDNRVVSLFKNKGAGCIVSNALFIKGNGLLDLAVNKAQTPVSIILQPFKQWQSSNPAKALKIIIVLVFAIVFFLIFIIQPQVKYFIPSSSTALILMVVMFWLGRDIPSQAEMMTRVPVKSADIFYNNSANFSGFQRVAMNDSNSDFKADIDLSENNFLRCDVDPDTKVLQDFHVITRMGILKNNWDFSKLPLDKMVINDMTYQKGTFIIRGNDPYFCLTSEYFLGPLQWILLLRKNLFLFITLFIFLLFLVVHRWAAKQKPSASILAGIFLAIIFSSLLIGTFNSDRLVMVTEKRNAASFPSFNASLEHIVSKMDDYLKDQLPGRNPIITLNNLARYTVFGRFDNPFVHFGKDGWMFYIGDKAKEMYENRHPLTTVELEEMKNVMVSRCNWLKERGIKFYIIFPRSSNFVYEEKIGEGLVRYNKKSKLEQLLEYLHQHSDLNIIDSYTPIAEAKKKYHYDLYYNCDTHWNYVGAYFAYSAIVNAVRKDFPGMRAPGPFYKIGWLEVDNGEADLAKMVSLSGYVKRHDYMPYGPNIFNATDTLYPVYPEYTSPFPGFFVKNDSVKSPSMMMFHDSYACYLMAYLGYNFSRCSYLWSPIFIPTIVEKEKPDVVIWEMSDRFIYDILAENPPLPEMKDSIAGQTNKNVN